MVLRFPLFSHRNGQCPRSFRYIWSRGGVSPFHRINFYKEDVNWSCWSPALPPHGEIAWEWSQNRNTNLRDGEKRDAFTTSLNLFLLTPSVNSIPYTYLGLQSIFCVHQFNSWAFVVCNHSILSDTTGSNFIHGSFFVLGFIAYFIYFSVILVHQLIWWSAQSGWWMDTYFSWRAVGRWLSMSWKIYY